MQYFMQFFDFFPLIGFELLHIRTFTFLLSCMDLLEGLVIENSRALNNLRKDSINS